MKIHDIRDSNASDEQKYIDAVKHYYEIEVWLSGQTIEKQNDFEGNVVEILSIIRELEYRKNYKKG